MLLMTLTAGDLAAFAAVVGVAVSLLAALTRYFVRAEIEHTISDLRIELADRAQALASELRECQEREAKEREARRRQR